MAYRDTVKPWFVTEYKPTQAQFYQLFDYLFFKDEGISIADVAGLIAALTGKAEKAALDAFEQGERIEYGANGYYDIPAGYLLEIAVVVPGSDANISVGTTLLGTELYDSEPVTAAEGLPLVMNQFAKNTKRIYFTGIPAGSYITFLKRKIKTTA